MNKIFALSMAALLVLALLIHQADAVPMQPHSQYIVTINGYPGGFSPNLINIKSGDSVIFVNEDNSGFYGYEVHRVISINSKTGQPNGYFDSGSLYLGEKYVAKFSKPGNYTYIEALDPSTTGQIIVSP